MTREQIALEIYKLLVAHTLAQATNAEKYAAARSLKASARFAWTLADAFIAGGAKK